MARTILVVDDEPTLRETIVDALEADGFRVVSAAATTRNPSASSASTRVSRRVGSSSTTRIVRAIQPQDSDPC